MLNAIAKANMVDTENRVAVYFGSNRQIRKNAIAAASDRFRAIITSLPGELEGTARSLSDKAGNTTRLAAVVANACNNVQSVASATEELASSVREISAQVQESNRITASAVTRAGRNRLADQRAVAGRKPDRRRHQADYLGRRADQPVGTQLKPPALAKPAAALLWSPRRSTRWPRRPPRPPTKSASRSQACKPRPRRRPARSR
jgi:hypothetical protein